MKDNDQDNALDGGANLEDLASFFAPSWAKDDNASRVTIAGGAGRRFDDDRPRRDFGDDRPRRDGDRPRRDFGGDRPRRDGDRPRRDFGDDRPRRDGDRPRSDFGDDRPRRDGDRPRRDFGDDRPRRDGDRPRRDFDGDRRERQKPEEPLTLGVRFLPEGKALDAIIRRIQSTRKAYPFRDIVSLFQKDDSSLMVRIEADRTADPSAVVCQCRHCGLPALSAEEAVAHAFDAHFADFFEVREIEGEAPKGNFPCIARCGLSGELLGPPNHHSYAGRIEEVRREKFPTMSPEEFRRHIEMVRDPEVVEQWRVAAKKHTLYFRIKAEAEKPAEEKPAAEDAPAEDAPAEGAPAEGAATEGAPAEGEAAAAAEPVEEKGLQRAEAEAIFRREIAPTLVASAPHIVCKATVLKNMPNRRLASFLSREFSHDEAMHAQGTLARAIHGAFNHRKLVFFRANEERGQEFVASIAPVKFEVENAAPEIRSILDFVADNPSAQQKALVEALVPDGAEEKVKPLLASLRWLVDKGYVVEFFNGILSLGTSHPTYRPGQKKPHKAAAPAKPEAETKEKAEPTGEAEAPAAEAETSAPAADEAPAATTDEAPVATEAETPAPAEAEAPAAEAEAPAPAEAEAPVPAEAEAPVPAEAAAPAAEAEAPAPAEAEAPLAKDAGNENP